MTDLLVAQDPPFRLTAPIEHLTELPDGTLLAHVTVTSETPDNQADPSGMRRWAGEIVDYDAFKAAAPELMKWAVVDEMHDDARSDAGTILQLQLDDAHRRAEADLHIVDPVAVKKVKNRVYKMVSLGGAVLGWRLENVAGKTYRRLTKILAESIALVPRGANPDALIAKQFVLAKRSQEAATMPDEIDAGTTSPLDGSVAVTGEARTPEQIAIDETREALAKAEMDTADVNDLPDSDFAYIEPGGSKDESGKTVPRSKRHFPIHDAAHVRNALARLSTSPFEAKARPKVEAAARRLGIGEPAGKGDMETAEKTEKIKKAKAEPTAEELEYKRLRKQARDARKMRKARSVLSKEEKRLAKNKALDAALDAHEAVGEAVAEETKEQAEGSDESKDLEALHTADEALHEFTGNESKEPVEKQYRAMRRDIRRMRKIRRAAVELDREQRRLAKIGKRNSAGDEKQQGIIHDALVKLGYSKCMVKADGLTKADTAETPLEKVDKSPDAATIIREALASVLPLEKIEAIESKIAAADERSKAQSDLLEKIAKTPSGGGPATRYSPVFRTSPEGDEVTDKGSALRKAASVVDDPRLKEQLSSMAATEMIRAARS